jgi:hypothetical protein
MCSGNQGGLTAFFHACSLIALVFTRLKQLVKHI